MNISQRITHSFIAGLSVVLSFGVLTHDTHAEKVYTTISAVGGASAYAEAEQQIPQRSLDEIRTGQHTHVSDNPLSNTLANSFSYQSPSIAPRRDSHHKQLLHTLEIGGRHAFDNANLPIIF